VFTLEQEIDIEPEGRINRKSGDEKPYLEDLHITLLVPIDDEVHDREDDHSSPKDEEAEQRIVERH